MTANQKSEWVSTNKSKNSNKDDDSDIDNNNNSNNNNNNNNNDDDDDDNNLLEKVQSHAINWMDKTHKRWNKW